MKGVARMVLMAEVIGGPVQSSEGILVSYKLLTI